MATLTNEISNAAGSVIHKAAISDTTTLIAVILFGALLAICGLGAALYGLSLYQRKRDAASRSAMLVASFAFVMFVFFGAARYGGADWNNGTVDTEFWFWIALAVALPSFWYYVTSHAGSYTDLDYLVTSLNPDPSFEPMGGEYHGINWIAIRNALVVAAWALLAAFAKWNGAVASIAFFGSVAGVFTLVWLATVWECHSLATQHIKRLTLVIRNGAPTKSSASKLRYKYRTLKVMLYLCLFIFAAYIATWFVGPGIIATSTVDYSTIMIGNFVISGVVVLVFGLMFMLFDTRDMKHSSHPIAIRSPGKEGEAVEMAAAGAAAFFQQPKLGTKRQ